MVAITRDNAKQVVKEAFDHNTTSVERTALKKQILEVLMNQEALSGRMLVPNRWMILLP